MAIPVNLAEANDIVANFHRHNRPVVGGRFAIGASHEGQLVGVAIVGRPVARALDDGMTAEVTRLCVLDSAPKGAPSFLYSRCWRAWSAMGGARLVTYTLQSESGASLRGAGWRVVGQSPGWREGTGWTNRPGREWQPVTGQAKLRWQYPAQEKGQTMNIRDFIPGRLGHATWCAHIVEKKPCDCGASIAPVTPAQQGGGT